MKAKASTIAQKLLNLYRQAHVINGGWGAVNRVFMNEATDDVLAAMLDLPTGKFLAQHIKNLRDGKTKIDSIARELLPYGGMMDNASISSDVPPDNIDSLISAIDKFEPNQNSLENFMNLPIIKTFGSDWVAKTKQALGNQPEALQKFDMIVQAWHAYHVLNQATEILDVPINDRVRAQLQVDMPEYETYLPMFGDDGRKLLRQLHRITSSMPNQESDS